MRTIKTCVRSASGVMLSSFLEASARPLHAPPIHRSKFGLWEMRAPYTGRHAPRTCGGIDDRGSVSPDYHDFRL